MKIEFKSLNVADSDIDIVTRINNEAFPPYERLSMDKIFDFVENANTELLGIYDNGALVGFVMIVKGDRCGYVFFYAIANEYRSKGYGGAALKALFDRYADMQIILDFEKVDENAENYEQRVRRKNFYLRNGFFETGRYTLMEGEPFEVVCNEGELDVRGLCDLIKTIHSRVPEFADVLV